MSWRGSSVIGCETCSVDTAGRAGLIDQHPFGAVDAHGQPDGAVGRARKRCAAPCCAAARWPVQRTLNSRAGHALGAELRPPRERQSRDRSARARARPCRSALAKYAPVRPVPSSARKSREQRLARRDRASAARCRAAAPSRNAQSERVAQRLDDGAAQLPRAQLREQVLEHEVDVRARQRDSSSSRGGAGWRRGRRARAAAARRIREERARCRSKNSRRTPASAVRRADRAPPCAGSSRRGIEQQRKLLAKRVAGRLRRDGWSRRMRRPVRAECCRARRRPAPASGAGIAARIGLVAEQVGQPLRREVRGLDLAHDLDEAARGRGIAGR